MQEPGGQRICHLLIFSFIPDPPQSTPGSGPASSYQHCPNPLTEALVLAQLLLPPFSFKEKDGGHNVRRKQDSFGGNSGRSGHAQPLSQELKEDSYSKFYKHVHFPATPPKGRPGLRWPELTLKAFN